MSQRSRRKTPIPEPEPPKRQSFAHGEWWEWLLTFLAIAALWPTIMRWEGIWWDVALWAVLAAMIWVFIRRSRRVKEEWKGRKK